MQLVSSKDEEALHQNLLAAIQEGMPPTLAFARPSDMADYLDADALLPLDSLGGLEEGSFTDYDSNFFDALRYGADNRLYAWAVYRYQTLLFMNRTYASLVGGHVPPTSWEDLVKTCAAYLEGGGKNCLAIYPTGDVELLWIVSHGGSIVDETGKKALFGDALAEVLYWLAELRAQGGVYQAASVESQRDAFINGETLFTFDSTQAIPEYDRMNSAFDMVVLPPPFTGEAPVTMATGGNLVLFRQDKREETLAKDFLAYLTEESINSSWASALGAYPVRRSALEKAVLSWPDASPVRQAAEWLPYARSEPILAAWPQIKEVLAEAMMDVINGSQTPEEALKEAMLKADGYLSQ